MKIYTSKTNFIYILDVLILPFSINSYGPYEALDSMWPETDGERG